MFATHPQARSVHDKYKFVSNNVLIVWPSVLCLSVCTQQRLALLPPGRIPLLDSTHIYSHSFLYAVLRGFLISLPRWLSIYFFFKALVGEHKVLTFLYDCMAMILTPLQPTHCIRSHSDIVDHTKNLRHALLYQSNCPYPRGRRRIHCFLCSRSFQVCVRSFPGCTFPFSVSAKEIYLLDAIQDCR